MLFVGDIAAPRDLYPRDNPLVQVAGEDLVVANLEGAILRGEARLDLKTRLFNHHSTISYLRRINVGVVSLANNHVFDLGPEIQSTVKQLEVAGIRACGAGRTIEQAAQPVVLHREGKPLVFLSFGWKTIECPPARSGRPGVNPLEPRHVLRSVESVRQRHPEGTVVLLMHWDYELELYPMPMHRQLAFRAIDCGADAVIGCHSHCVQGIEVHNGAPIVYGLGNWFLTQGEFFGGRLRYPDFSSLELAFQWRPESGDMICHWFEYRRDDHSLRWTGSEPLAESRTVARLTPFRGMGHREYTRWFREHRRKRALLPVYSDPDAVLANRLRDGWVALRQVLIRLAFALRIKGGPR